MSSDMRSVPGQKVSGKYNR